MPISTIGQNGLNAPITLTSPVINTVTSAAATALTLQSAGTTAVTVDTSQNVLIGATSNSSSTSTPKVFIAAGSSTSTTIQAMPCGAIMNNSVNTNSSGYGVSLKFLMSGGEPGKYAAIAGIGDSNFANSTALTFYTNPNGVNGADNNVERMRINSSGNVILGSNTSTTANNVLNLWSPTSTLNGIYMQKNGQVEVQMGFKASTNTDFYIGTGSTTMGAYGVYLANTGNSWISVSDVRQKDIIEPIENGLTKVSAIRAVIGKYKHDADGVRRSFLIAQDVQAVFPEAVKVQEDEEALLGLSYTDVIPLLVASIKELKTIVDAQAAEIAELKTRLTP